MIGADLDDFGLGGRDSRTRGGHGPRLTLNSFRHPDPAGDPGAQTQTQGPEQENQPEHNDKNAGGIRTILLFKHEDVTHNRRLIN